jgi:predicted esterase
VRIANTINLLIGSLAIILGGLSVLAGPSVPTGQVPDRSPLPAMMHKDSAETDNGARPNNSARVTEQKSIAGVPVLISKPRLVNPNTRLVVLYHGFGPPQNPRALAEVLRLGKMDAVLAFVNLPMVADRMPAGGKDELLRVQKEDFVNGFFFRSISGASAELPQIVNELNATYHLDSDKGIGLFGFSAGGAAALLALLESAVPVKAAVIVNAPMSVMQNVENWQRTLKRQFEWDNASRKAASRYDVERQADKIAERKILPALLIMQGDADKQLGVETARRAFETLKQRYVGRGEAERIQFEVIHGLAHNFGPGSGATGSDETSINLEIEQKTEQWFQRFLRPGPSGSLNSCHS